MSATPSPNKALPAETPDLERRRTILGGVFLGGALLAASQGAQAISFMTNAPLEDAGTGRTPYGLQRPEAVIYTTCLQCRTDCPIKVKFQGGTLVKIDGNPYSPQNLVPHLPWSTPLAAAAALDAKLCPKGQSGVQSHYDPYRIRKVLKRKPGTKRGAGKWVTVPFATAVQEIVEGGNLFGEGNVAGLKDVFAVRDPAVMTALATDAALVAAGTMTVASFKTAHAAQLDLLIDPDHPDLGPKNNQFAFMAGRIEEGRRGFIQRWSKDAFGSPNWFDHFSICEVTRHKATMQATHGLSGGKWSGGTHHIKPDTSNAEFILYVGTGAFEANFGPTVTAEKVSEGLVSGRLKIAVSDPRLSKTATKAWKWLPVAPGGDGPMAMGIIRRMLDTAGYDSKYLANANQAAADADSYPSYSSATNLVKIEGGRPTKYLRASEVSDGLGGSLGDANTFVVSAAGSPAAVGTTPREGDLDFAGSVAGLTGPIEVKSAFRLLKEAAEAHTVEEWTSLAGLPKAEDLVAVADELVRHGHKSVVEYYRGVSQHTTGFYDSLAVLTINTLLGNLGFKGGWSSGGGAWDAFGGKTGQPFKVGSMFPGKLGFFGVPVTREGVAYEKSSLFATDGYPAKRPWFPLTEFVYQEILPSAAMGYPYPLKVLWMHKASPGMTIPGANEQLKVLADPSKVPLLIATDIVLGDTTVFADYAFPDLSIWERWCAPSTTPEVPVKSSKVRQPAAAPVPEDVTVFGETVPCSAEALALAFAEKLAMKGFGPDGFGTGVPLTRPEHYFLKLVANIAAGDSDTDRSPPADDAELAVFRAARAHLPPSVFDEAKWKAAVQGLDATDWMARVVYVLNRGGRWEGFSKAYSGDKMGHPRKGRVNVFIEPVAQTKNALTGIPFSGVPTVGGVFDAKMEPLDDSAAYPLAMITFKEIIGVQTRNLPGNYWLAGMMPENKILLHPKTGAEQGLADGDRVRIRSATNPEGVWKLPSMGERVVAGKVRLVEWIRPGVVAVASSFGHWAYGARDEEVDGVVVRGEARRLAGLQPNAVFRLDPVLGDVGLTDPIAGGASFYDTRVKLTKEA